jgi:glycosyltransferase involved in cell wall biosynthesis
MRVAMLAYAFCESDTRILQYSRALAERGDTVDVIALRKEGTSAFETMDGVNLHRIQLRRVDEQTQLAYAVRILRFLVMSAIVLTRKHLARRYNVIHIHNVPDFLVFAALIPKLMGARVILDIHDIVPEFYCSKFRTTRDSRLVRLLVLIEKLSIAFSSHVIIANDIWRERIISRSAHSSKCTTILNYPDSRIFYLRPRAKLNGNFLLLYPGSLNTHQGVDVAIRAFAQVVRQVPKAEFQIYGEGPTKAGLRRLADDLGLSERVTFHGFLPTNEIAEVMAKADCGVVPKRAGSIFGNEAASTKIMEFMALGVPVVVSRTKVDSLYHDESRVKFFESENESDLATSILLLQRDPHSCAELVANALRYVEQNSWEERKHDYLNLVDLLAFRARRPNPRRATA